MSRSTPDDRRTTIVEVARQVFSRDGYGGSSMSGIAADLGGSKGTLYKYFDTKGALFEAVMLQCCKDMFVDFNGDLTRYKDVREYLIDAGTRMLPAMLESSALDISRLVLSEGVRHPQIARIYAEKALDPADEAVALGLAHFHSIGQIECPDALSSAKQFMGLLRADIHLRAVCGLDTRPGDGELLAHIIGVTSLFIAGNTSNSADSSA
ncbi:TetR/AcrR family transcriptional regulator [Sphingomonas ginsenosidivorax]|uniref:TetR/AcrR family transcriptional regulator n=1 Tax=Sphingomonas ginsenosidivorax TaxID=862135 RepID=UPI001315A6A6|nr:TetR/AcrR family transcriptional regulator [Sphingomonas ginsenosidivorax]